MTFTDQIDEWGSTDDSSNLKQKSTQASEQTTTETSSSKSKTRHSPRKRPPVHQLSDLNIRVVEKKRNYNPEADINLSSLDLRDNSKENPESLRTNERTELVPHPKTREPTGRKEQATGTATNTTVIKSSPSTEISITIKQPSLPEKVIQSLLRYPDLLKQDIDGDT